MDMRNQLVHVVVRHIAGHALHNAAPPAQPHERESVGGRGTTTPNRLDTRARQLARTDSIGHHTSSSGVYRQGVRRAVCRSRNAAGGLQRPPESCGLTSIGMNGANEGACGACARTTSSKRRAPAPHGRNGARAHGGAQPSRPRLPRHVSGPPGCGRHRPALMRQSCARSAQLRKERSLRFAHRLYVYPRRRPCELRVWAERRGRAQCSVITEKG